MLFRIAYAVARWIVGIVVAILGGLRVEGRENLPAKGGWILAANHVSYLDPPVLGLAVWRPVRFMAKEGLFRLPLLGPLMRFFGTFPVRPDAPDRAALRQAQEVLAAGEPLAIFPEGTCSRDGRLMPLRPGLALIALRTGAPIVPAAILGTQRALPVDVYRPRRVPGGLTVRFGKPIDPGDLPAGAERKEQVEALTERVEAALRELLRQPADEEAQTGSSSTAAVGGE